jgi:hypothetical protein
MTTQKLEWLKDYKEFSVGMWLVPDPSGLKQIQEYQASSELIEYKKREIINVEKRDRTLFLDVDRGILFAVHDPRTYRLF